MASGDPLSTALAVVRERNEGRIAFYAYTEYTVEHDAAEGDVRRLLAALDAVLEHHRPVQLYGFVEDFNGNVTCGHGGDYDGDAHFEGDDGVWYCKGKPTVTVCASCCDESDSDLRAAWPCPTYADAARELTGKGDGNG